MFNTRKKQSTELRSAVEEFLANGGAVTKVKTKKAPKNRMTTYKPGSNVMGPKMQSHGNNGKTA